MQSLAERAAPPDDVILAGIVTSCEAKVEMQAILGDMYQALAGSVSMA